jgi:hypothetical protein
MFRSVDGPKAIRSEFNRFHGRPLPDIPQTFTEHLYHRMIAIHGKSNPTFTRLADKYLAREYIREKIGDRYLVEMLWNGTDPRQIPFDALPDVSMAKTNHASGMTMVLRQPIDRTRVIDQFDKWLALNYYWVTRELQYLDIKPRIMVEEFLDDGRADGPLDYRFWCFHGKPALIQIDNKPHTINPFYDLEWNDVGLSYRSWDAPRDIPRPAHLDEMIAVSEALSAGFDFVRVDLFNVKGRVVAGELTFTPVIGQLDFRPKSWDSHLGKLWNNGAVI